MKSRKNIETFIIAILIPIAVGSISTLFTKNVPATYNQLTKPDFSPPSYIFPIVWLILYILMGISSYLIYISTSQYRTVALRIYAIQLFFNFFWSIIFFGLQMYLLAFIWIWCLIMLIILMILVFYQIRPLAAFLQIPYLLWCIFAAYLNFSIYMLNK